MRRVCVRRVRGGTAVPVRGYTLIELMVTVAVMAVVLAIATPSFTSVVNGNRLGSQTEELVSSLQFARSEALRRSQVVTLCQTADGATCGVAPAGQMQWVAIANGAVVRSFAIKPPVVLFGSTNTVRFMTNGMADTDADFTLCIPTTLPAENQRVVSLLVGGRSAVARRNGNGECEAEEEP